MAELRALAVVTALVLALPAIGGQTRTITIEGMKFAPASFTVKQGDTVVWENRDLVVHTVTSRGAFDSGPIAAGKAWRQVTTKAGRYEVVCTLHPTMKATLVVE